MKNADLRAGFEVIAEIERISVETRRFFTAVPQDGLAREKSGLVLS